MNHDILKFQYYYPNTYQIKITASALKDNFLVWLCTPVQVGKQLVVFLSDLILDGFLKVTFVRKILGFFSLSAEAFNDGGEDRRIYQSKVGIANVHKELRNILV